ncbi:hypothetical protein IGI37_003667 [Enterococcus sp. AZ194]|uniref:type II toxin-antitoxin system RelB family antitoxin n=1 Tax=Enterococcus sp. AZ194 TaxID=2774629 RepID=UPI003F201EFA
MAAISVYVSDSERQHLSCMATFYGVTLSSLLKNYSMEQLEKEYHRQTAQSAQTVQNYQFEGGKRNISVKKIVDEFKRGI